MNLRRPLDRRQALVTLGTAGLGAVLVACSSDTTTSGPSSTTTARTGTSPTRPFDESAACTLTAEQTEGPFYVDVDMLRSDIREDREGVPLRLTTRVLDASSCQPLPDAVVDVWHCDASGVYSAFESAQGSTFLRGAQVTDSSGVAEFSTIHPGWYRGRTTHIHAKIHLDGTTAVTTQLYFPDDVNDAVYGRAPYTSSGQRTHNRSDSIFDESLVMTVEPDGDGYQARMTINVLRAGRAG